MPSDAKKKAVMVTAGVALIAAAAGTLAFMFKRKKDETIATAWNRFMDIKAKNGTIAGSARAVEGVKAEGDCKQLCADDATCRACSYMPSAQRCILTTDDPYSAEWLESPLAVTLVKRETTEQESSWGTWNPPSCPDECNPNPTPRTRQCVGGGKCIGPSSVDCPAIPCVPFDEIPSGWAPPPGNTTGWSTSDAASEAECRSACVRDTTCTGYAYDSSAKKCYKSPANMAITSVGPYPASKLKWGIRSSDGWDALPSDLGSPCKLGMGQWERACPEGGCTLGVKNIGCPAIPVAWDRFTDVRFKN